MFVGAGAYICGEETALLESLEGKPGKPRFKPPFPAGFGLYGKPTTINNTQSFASVPTICARARVVRGLGPPNSGGTAIFSVSGHVANPGNFELPLGIPFKDVLALAGGVWKGRKLKAVIPGGSSVNVLPAAAIHGHQHGLRFLEEGGFVDRHRRHDRHGRNHLHGAHARALVALLHVRILRPVHPVPRRHRLARSRAQAHLGGAGRSEDLTMLVDVANRIEGHTICALGDAAAWPVQSFMKHFRHEFQYMIEHKGRSIVTAQAAAA
jgi:NADH-quinone oxidoreductase subunit F